LRADRLSCYGSAHLKTPNFDSLAERGTLFSRAFANTSTTLPSHTNILLGTSPLYHGVHENTNFVVRDNFLTLAEHLKAQGYATGAFVGAYPLDSRFGLHQGFDVYDDDYGRSRQFQSTFYVQRRAEAVVSKALEWLNQQSSSWFLWIHCFDPHDPYEPPEPYRTQYANRLYDGEVAYVDFAMGKLIRHLTDSRLFDETVIIFTGDHGESLGQHGEKTHGFFAYNTAIWIPLIIAVPGMTPGQTDHYVSHLDVFPTVCDVLGVDNPGFLQGISLLPAIKGKKLPDRPIYFESLSPYYSRGWAPIRGFIAEKKKYIESPLPELYDLGVDFDERKNLADSQKLDAYRKELKRIQQSQSIPDSDKARQKSDRKTLEKLRSLGYVSSSHPTRKSIFGPEDDVKVLLPFYYRVKDAADLYRQGKRREGIELLKEVITENPKVDTAYHHLAAFYKDTGRMVDALEVLKLGLENNPASYEIFYYSIDFLAEAGRPDEAILLFESRHFPQVEVDPEVWNTLGIAYGTKKDFAKAIEAFEYAVSLDREYRFSFLNLGRAHLSRFLETKDRQSYRNSIENFKKAIELDPGFAPAYFDLGMAYIQAGNLDGAIYCWEKTLELDSDFDGALFNLALAHRDKGHKAKALVYLKRYKQRNYQLLPPGERKKLDSLIEECEAQQ
jgi:arylsulfatase A-like enzyme/Tfp pilus assembly protein PilF